MLSPAGWSQFLERSPRHQAWLETSPHVPPCADLSEGGDVET